MRIIAGKVKGGVVVPEDSEGLVEGTDVGVVTDDGEASFTAPPEDEAALLAALAEDAGTVSSEDLLSRLR
jgi:glucokinase